MIEIDMVHATGDFAFDLVSAQEAIGAAMCWPHDIALRYGFLSSRHLARTKGIAIEDASKKYTKLIPKGIAAGAILLDTIKKYRVGNTFKMSDFKSLFADLPDYGYSLKTIDNDICVAPFWAVYIDFKLECRLRENAFPCPPIDLSEFIERAHEYKVEAGTIRTPRSKETSLLRAEDDYALSEAITRSLPTAGSVLIVKLNQFLNSPGIDKSVADWLWSLDWSALPG